VFRNGWLTDSKLLTISSDTLFALDEEIQVLFESHLKDCTAGRCERHIGKSYWKATASANTLMTHRQSPYVQSVPEGLDL